MHVRCLEAVLFKTIKKGVTHTLADFICRTYMLLVEFLGFRDYYRMEMKLSKSRIAYKW